MNFAQLITPTYDESKFYQIRAIENGPWDFRPEWYYKSWYKEDFLWWDISVPGLGFHDDGPAGIGGGDNYIDKYQPNVSIRVETAVTSELEKQSYTTELQNIEKWRDREIANDLDRSIDLADPVMKEKINDSKSRFTNNMFTYLSIATADETSKALYLVNEFDRTVDNINLIKKSYLSNAKKQEAYVEGAKQIDDLNECVVALLRFAYNKKINSEFFKK
ncbi:hypothetical protein FACS189451_03750 [Bacteroidia bacterium]|nr:hypothetical protein FACS189446_1550 [Bacteroidia bacterium]GHT61538.1 hypothetical protein FACS189451_03750 [Bacteroidia bacterium]